MTDPTPANPQTRGLDAAQAHLQDVLGRDGWRVYRKRNTLKARWRWYKITLKYRPDHVDEPWRARMRDGGIPVITQRSADPLEALQGVVTHAVKSAQFCEGRLGLVRNPSKSYLAHRLLQAVRPR